MPSSPRTRGLSIALVVSLTLSLATAVPAVAAPYQPGVAQREQAIAGSAASPRSTEPTPTGVPFTAASPVWPKASTTEVKLDGTVVARKAIVPGTPVSLVTAAKSAAKAKVQTFDRGVSQAAGVDGVLFRVSGADVKVAVDYSAFRWAYGGDWAGRLRLTELPECALTTPAKAECQGKPVESHNDLKRGIVTSTNSVSSSGALLALAAGTASGSGTYAATSLTPTSTWNSGGNSGGFNWSYPFRMPPSLGGPAPALALEYSSASVDGLTAASNNQPSWVGQGFQLSSNFIERKYQSCSADMADGARNTVKTGDLCWVTDNAVLSMSGHSGELIKDPDPLAPNRWRLRNDDGTYVDHRTGGANGARGGEHWVVTVEGTQYWFGRNTQSTLTAQVAGNHAGEPCAANLFKDSFCTQAYRWNLEYVVDQHGNTMTYQYAKETNKYARNGSNTDVVEYDRSAYLERIDYGTRVDRTETAPTQVLFGTEDRCLVDCGVHDAAHWADTPWDQACTGSPCTTGSPSFWSTKRLTTITTVVSGSPVEKWTLSQSFPDPGDGTRAGLWLDGISHQGLVDEITSVPDVRFTGVQLSNRVDTHSDQHAAMKWWRVKRIETETGGWIDVRYSEPDCVAGSRVPNGNALQDNTLRCYPVRWKPDGAQDSILDFFHKYVVAGVTENDTTGGAPPVTTDYEYVGAPAWHFTDDDGLIKAEDKSWSVWRGYEFVRTFKGTGAERTKSETRFFRGMNGDKLPNGVRTAELPAITVGSVAAATDEDAYAGMVRETVTYDGTTEVSATVNEPWQSPPSASRTINGSTVHARFSGLSTTHGRTKLDGSRGYRTTTKSTVFDGTYGSLLRSEDRGDDAVVGDENCLLVDYARNTGTWMINTVSRKRTFVVDCAKALTDGLQDDDVAADDRTYYDGGALGVAPTKGEASKIEKLKSHAAGVSTYLTAVTSEYDVYGRVTKTTDLKGTNTSAYTPAAGGPVTRVVTTNPLGWQTTTNMKAAWQVPESVIDSNQRRVDMTFDGLGRTTAVWFPDRSKTQYPSKPNRKFSYLVRQDAPPVVATQALNPAGDYVTTYEFLDSLLRPRQTQLKDASGTTAYAVVADTFYDSAGRPSKVNAPYLSTIVPGSGLFVPTAVIPTQTSTVYDGAGRTVASITRKQTPPASPGGVELFRTTTSYAGDRVDITPPSGGTPTSTLTDARGRTTEQRSYHAGAAVGSSTPSDYDAAKYSYHRSGALSRVVDSAGKEWTYTNDLLGRQVQSTDPDRGTTTSVYGDADQLLSTTDGLGTTLAYTYDGLGRKTTMRQGSATGPKRAEWVYDTTAGGTQVNGQLVKSIRYSGVEAYINEVLTFTPDYQPMDTQVTIPDGEGDLAGTYPYFTAYNEARTPETTRIPAAGDLQRETVKHQYDALGQPTALLSGLGSRAPTALVSSTSYTAFGELGGYVLAPTDGANVDVLREYDTWTRRLTRISTSKETAPTAIADVGYTYDDIGNVTKIADSVAGDNQCFRNDYLQRVSEAWTPASGDCAAAPTANGLGGPAKYWQSFTYNAVGDRTKLVEHATSAGNRTTTYTPTPGKHSLASTTTTDNAGSRLATYGYDAVGNTKTRPTPSSGGQTLTWDPEGHLETSVDSSGTTSFLYDADGNRLVRRDPTGRTLYLPGQEVRVTTATGAKTCTRYFSYAGETIGTRTAGKLTWLSDDRNGTTGISVDSAASQTVGIRRSMPFGEVRGTLSNWLPSLDKGFVGGTIDNTGLTHLGAREYDPSVGRFVSVDPLMELANSRQWNAYSYANNSPVTFSDPTGLAGRCGPDGAGCAVPNRDTCCGPSVDDQQYFSWNSGSGFITTYDRKARQYYVNTVLLPDSHPDMGKLIEALRKDVQYTDDRDPATGLFNYENVYVRLERACSIYMSQYDCSTQFSEDIFLARPDIGMGTDAFIGMLGSVRVFGQLGRGGGSGPTLPGKALCAARNSFSGDTPVLMADGSTKRIDEIVVGDAVAAGDPERGLVEGHVVTAVIVTDADKDYVDVVVGTPEGEQTIKATAHHPFYDPLAQEWVDAENLEPGDLLSTTGGGQVDVRSARHHTATLRTFNLTVDELHTYYVVAGKTPVLVHNDNNANQPPGWAREEIERIKAGQGTPRMTGDNQTLYKGKESSKHLRKWGKNDNGYEGTPEWEVKGKGDMYRIVGPNQWGEYGYTSTKYRVIAVAPSDTSKIVKKPKGC